VCEAVAFAHAQGVIHRDLKPGNVMVGGFGETYVMDWGLARVLGEAEGGAGAGIESERRELAQREPESPLVTRQGDVVGTPVYMPPEQARGELERVGPDHPEVPTWHYVLGTTLGNIARREPDVTAALLLWDEVVQSHATAVAKSNANVSFRESWLQSLRDRATWLCEHRLHREAVAAAAALAAAAPDDAGTAVDAATYVGHAARIGSDDGSLAAEARAAQAAAYWQSALAHLRQAIARGCRYRGRLTADHFAFLRGDPAYEELLAGLPPD
jgi:hypothetical protein